MREKPEGIVNSHGGSKVMLPPALIILHKNEESRSGSISFGNLHPSPDSSFLFWDIFNNTPGINTHCPCKTARLGELIICKTFRPRLCFLQPVYSLTSPLKRPENSPISKYFLQGGGLWAADFGWGLVKLGVPGRDVGADGEIVWANASCSPSVSAFSPSPELLSFPYPLERKPNTVPLPAEYVL